MKKQKTSEREYIEIMCEAYTMAIKEALLEKQQGERIVIIGEVGANDLVNGYTVDIKKIK